MLDLFIEKYGDFSISIWFPVIDCYQGWCGPCIAMQSTLKKLKIDLGDDLLHFAIVKKNLLASFIDVLIKSDGVFLLFLSRQKLMDN